MKLFNQIPSIICLDILIIFGLSPTLFLLSWLNYLLKFLCTSFTSLIYLLELIFPSSMAIKILWTKRITKGYMFFFIVNLILFSNNLFQIKSKLFLLSVEQDLITISWIVILQKFADSQILQIQIWLIEHLFTLICCYIVMIILWRYLLIIQTGSYLNILLRIYLTLNWPSLHLLLFLYKALVLFLPFYDPFKRLFNLKWIRSCWQLISLTLIRH